MSNENPEWLELIIFDWFDVEEEDVEYYFNLLKEMGYDVTIDEVRNAVKKVRKMFNLDPDTNLKPKDKKLF